MRLLKRSLLAALLTLPCLGRAADLPVRYAVQEKPLKAAIAGTSLTFELFRDPACTTTAVHSTSVLIENVTFITKIKQFTPKGDTKLPSTDELAVTLSGVSAGGNLYLKVTGTGVVPVGGACQAQAAQVIAPNCVDGIRNQAETDVDCGGPTTCLRCAATKSCNANSDCQSNACQAGVCLAQATCTDGFTDGTETDVDCGGSCAADCALNKTCSTNGDCQTSFCTGGLCKCPSQLYTFTVNSNTGGVFDSAEWPGGTTSQNGPIGCSVTINRPNDNVDLACTLASPFSVNSFAGYSNCFGTGGEDGDGCQPVSCPPAGIGSCCSTRPSCSAALNGSATAQYFVQCNQ